MSPAVFFTVVSFLSGAFIVQASRLFAFGGVQPNFFLVVLSQCAVFFGFSKSGFLKFMASAGFTVFWLVLFFPFWRPELLIIFVVSPLVFLVKHFFSANEYVDLAIFILAAQVLFYGALWLIPLNTAVFSANFFYETAVSLIAGFLVLYLIQKFRN